MPVFKSPGERAAFTMTTMQGDFFHGLVGRGEEAAGLGQTKIKDIVLVIEIFNLIKHAAEIGGGDIHFLGNGF